MEQTKGNIRKRQQTGKGGKMMTLEREFQQQKTQSDGSTLKGFRACSRHHLSAVLLFSGNMFCVRFF